MGCSPSRAALGQPAAPGRLAGTRTPPDIRWEDHGVVELDSVRSMLSAGDLMFFCGQTLFGRIIRFGTHFHYSHVALVDTVAPSVCARCSPQQQLLDEHLRCPLCGTLHRSEVFLFESVNQPDGVVDIMTQDVHSGTRVCEFAARMRGTASAEISCSDPLLDLAVVKLEVRDVRALEPLVQCMRRFEYETCRRPYERDVLSMLRAQFPHLLGAAVEDARSYFCSELVADALRHMGVLPRDVVPAAVTPAMLAHSAQTFHERWGHSDAHTGEPDVFYQGVVHCFSLRRSQLKQLAMQQQQQQQQQYVAPSLSFVAPTAAPIDDEPLISPQQWWQHQQQQQQQQQQHFAHTPALPRYLPLDAPSPPQMQQWHLPYKRD